MLIISSDKAKLDVDFIHEVLVKTYWASHRTKEQVQESINHSLCFGMYLNDVQIGFARVITDRVTFSYLMDVFIEKKYYGSGYGKKLIAHIYKHNYMLKVANHFLITKDAQAFYEPFGFKEYEFPERFMVKKM